MAERTGDFEWRTEGDEAEVVLYGGDDSSVRRLLPATRLPGVVSPVYAAASSRDLGWVVSSSTHVAPDLVSVPVRGLLLATGVSVEGPGTPPSDEFVRRLFRNLSEVSLQRPGGAGIRRSCEIGAQADAEDGSIEEEDLSFFHLEAGDPDALGRRAISAGEWDWDVLAKICAYSVGEILNFEVAERLDLRTGHVVLTVEVGAGELGRLASETHRRRILDRIRAGIDFDSDDDLPAAPLEREEASDLLAASYAASNFSDGRCALALYTVRRALADTTSELLPLASWRSGGFEERDELLVHRRKLASVKAGETLVSGGNVATGTGVMSESAPSFEATEVESVWPWEEAGLLERAATLEEM